MKVVALLACHDRKAMTLRCLASFFSQASDSHGLELEAIVVDDGSNDGTGEAVRAEFGSATVLRGDGTLYWAGGMQLAESRAVAGRPDFLLWLNDDVVLSDGALTLLVSTAAAEPGAVVVGALVDPDSGSVTYSGVIRVGWHPLRTRLVVPGDRPRESDTFNGNVVLVPRAVYQQVGPIDGGFAHGQADFDYGLRARQLGFRVVVAAGVVGTCPRGTDVGTFSDPTLPLAERWALMQRPTGLPMRSHARYLRRHGGRAWPLFWAAPYARLLLNAIATAPRRRTARRA